MPNPTAPSDRRRPISILVVDDEAALLRAVTRFLAHLGYAVLEAPSAERALAMVRRREAAVDLVLSDVGLPGIDGLDLAAELLALRPAPRVLLMTSRVPAGVERLRVGWHLIPVVRKPFDLDQLAELIRATLAPAEAAPQEPPLRAG